jgi:hypothetical protein
MGTVELIALSMGAAWASGINLYATIVMLGFMGATGGVDLPPGLEILESPMVIAAAALMYSIEFFADKIPGVDSAWDAIHTFIRIPAGAMLAASAVGDVTPVMELTAGLLGGTLAAGTHATKMGSRLLINTSPEPLSNIGASLGEDVAVIAGLWAALQHPLWFVIALVLFVFLMIWLLPRLWKIMKYVFRKVGSWLGMCEAPSKKGLVESDL